MSGRRYINISINIKNGSIRFTKDSTPSPSRRFHTDDTDRSEADNVRIELGIAKVFHKVLNLIKADPDLFQKEDFELLGEMLSKILFGKLNNEEDFRNYIMKEVEQTLDLKNPTENKICRIFLEFDQKSGVAMLPWEYTLYKTRSQKETNSLYLSANTKSRFHLMRRVNDREAPDINAERLLVIVLANLGGNDKVTPRIDSRSREITEIKKLFTKLTDDNQNLLDVKILESVPFDEIKGEIESAYKTWQGVNGDNFCYAVHYVGHAFMDDQVGKLVIQSSKTNEPDWMADKDFASIFNDQRLDIVKPALVSFQACDSAKIGSIQDSLRGVAYEFTQLGIPAVVGMQNEINTGSSCAFFSKFYECILSGKDVAEAVTCGRDHLGRQFNIKTDAYTNNSFGSPVLFITTAEPIKLIKSEIPVVKDVSTPTEPSEESAKLRYQLPHVAGEERGSSSRMVEPRTQSAARSDDKVDTSSPKT